MASSSHRSKGHKTGHGNIALVAQDFPGRGSFPWNSPHFYAFLRRLIASGPEFRDDNYWDLRYELEKQAMRVVRYSREIKTFDKALGEFFKGPTLAPSMSSPCSPNNEVLVAAFIRFLLQTLKELAHCCNNMDLMVPLKEQVNILYKELSLVFIFLENTPLDGLENLLPEINDAANQAGSMLYSLFYTMKGTAGHLGFDSLLKRMKLLNGTIDRNCLGLVSKLLPTSQSNTATLVSPFVFHFLLQDLEDPLLLIPDAAAFEDQISTVCKGLKLLRSSLRDVESPGGKQQVEKLVMKIRAVAYDAGYIINLFLIGRGASPTPTLDPINERIKLVVEELVMMNKSAAARGVEQDPNPTIQSLVKDDDDDDDISFKDESMRILEEIVGGPDSLKIISIYGMSGLGKTFLARKLYNCGVVVERFDRRVWCVISQTYKRRSLLIHILNSVLSDLETEKMLTMEDERLGEEIYKCLKGRRYLIVLDDIWGISAWDDFRRYFPNDCNGSKILFTSRGKEVALEASGNTSIHALPFLSEDQCWELLKKKVFQTQDCLPELADIGKKIAAGCRGLPLSVVVIAAVLSRMEKKASLWEEVAGSMTSHISEDHQNVLELSYKHLPEHLKLCFLYFGAFPQATEIPVRKLISHWIAQGLVSDEEKSLEELGQKYLMELIDRSLVLVAKTNFDGGVKACAIHDLLHELCFRIAEKDKFLHPIGQEFSVSSTSRQIVLGVNVRSLLDFNPHHSSITFKSLKLVRVLQTSENSDLHGICFLIHLRYLEVEYLPASIGCLVNLQVLVVRKGGRISEVLLQMPNLQYVHFPSRIEFASSLNLLTSKNKLFQDNNIQSISFLRIDHERHIILKNFPNLRRLKCSFIASKDSSQNRCFYHVIDFLTQLESLYISLEGQVNLFSGVLSFPLNLKKLTLSRFILSWKEVSIIGGLPKLEVLKLLKVSMEKQQWNASEDEFQQLRFLKLDNVQIVDWNASEEHFPKLVQLVVRNCNILEEIPSSIGEIATLRMIQVELCRKSVAESAIRIRDEQQEMGNDQLKVIISR